MKQDDYSDMTATLGDRLTLAREHAGLSQKQLSGRLGVSPKTLGRWENDRSEPRGNRMQMLAGLLNVSVVWLISGAGPDPEADTSVDVAKSILADMSEIRRSQSRLSKRLGQLETRLREVLND
ncbi:helix-turn-helix domain-containing protein [Halovulum sp. GXIMD14793]